MMSLKSYGSDYGFIVARFQINVKRRLDLFITDSMSGLECTWNAQRPLGCTFDPTDWELTLNSYTRVYGGLRLSNPHRWRSFVSFLYVLDGFHVILHQITPKIIYQERRQLTSVKGTELIWKAIILISLFPFPSNLIFMQIRKDLA